MQHSGAASQQADGTSQQGAFAVQQLPVAMAAAIFAMGADDRSTWKEFSVPVNETSDVQQAAPGTQQAAPGVQHSGTVPSQQGAPGTQHAAPGTQQLARFGVAVALLTAAITSSRQAAQAVRARRFFDMINSP